MTYDSIREGNDREPLSLVKLHLPTCRLAYGAAPCMATRTGNMLRQSEELDGAYWARTQLNDVLIDNTTAPDGTVTAEKLRENTANSVHSIGATLQDTDYSDNEIVTFSFYAKPVERTWCALLIFDKAGTTTSVFFNLSTGALGVIPSGVVANISAAANGFYRCSMTMSIGAGTTDPQAIFRMATSDGVSAYTGTLNSGLFVWGAQFNRGALSDYAKTGHILNHLLHTEDFTNAAWVKTNSAETANAVIAPDQTMTADKLTETAVNLEHHHEQIISNSLFDDGVTYFFSGYFREAERDWVRLRVLDKSGTSHACFFDLLNGAIGTALNATGFIHKARNGFYRCGISFTMGAGGVTSRFRVQIASADNTLTHMGVVGEGIYAWGVQLTKAAAFTRYTKNITATDNPARAKTGMTKCFNTAGTCQDLENFDQAEASDAVDDANAFWNGVNGAAGVGQSFSDNKGTLILAYKAPMTADAQTGIEFLNLSIAAGNFVQLRWDAVNSTNQLVLTVDDNAGALSFATAGDDLFLGDDWSVFMWSWNGVSAGRRFYRNDSKRTITGANFNGAIDYGALNVLRLFGDGGTRGLRGSMHTLLFMPGRYIDFDKKTNRRRVFDDNGRLRDFGPDGSRLFGYKPLLYYRGGPSDIITGRGLLTTTLVSTSGAALTAASLTEPPPHMANTQVVHQFSNPISNLPVEVAAFPCLESATLSPTVLASDRGIGQRASITVNLQDFPYHDRGIDPYIDERDYDQIEQGTFFGRLMARNRKSITNRRLEVLVGYNQDDFDEGNFQARQYEVERLEGPDSNGNVKLTAKDPLKRIVEKKSQAPYPSQGRLNAAITAVATSCVLLPTGIGDAGYPLAGKAKIGSEVVSFTRTAGSDTLTLTAGRAQYNTVAAAHNADDAVQLCLEYAGVSAQEIVYDLLTNYSSVPVNFIDKDAWDAEAAGFLIRSFSALITTPTSVDELVKELTEQAPFYIWWDERTAKIRLKAIKAPDANITTIDDEGYIVADSMNASENQDARVSQVWVFYGQFDPTKSLTETSNYTNVHVGADLEAESEKFYSTPAIRKIFSRWITPLNQPAAEDAAATLLARFGATPRMAKFDMDAKDGDIWTGDIFNLRSRAIQAVDGTPENVVMQVTKVSDKESGHRFSYEALEFRGIEVDGTRNIIVSSDAIKSLNVRTAHDSIYGAPIGPVQVFVYIYSNAVLGSTDASLPAFRSGLWPAGSVITVENLGRIQGAGGDGGGGASVSPTVNATAGQVGGDAVLLEYPVNFTQTGAIWSGGGGGGGGGSESGGAGGGGGGGAGFQKTVAGARQGGDGGTAKTRPGAAGTDLAGGAGGVHWRNGGNGGGINIDGSAGQNGSGLGSLPGAAGGVKGRAIVGVAFATLGGTSDIRGAQV